MSVLMYGESRVGWSNIAMPRPRDTWDFRHQRPMHIPTSVIAALRRGNLAVFCTDIRARRGEIPAASADMTV